MFPRQAPPKAGRERGNGRSHGQRGIEARTIPLVSRRAGWASKAPVTKIIAITGGSGAGKTTVARALARLWGAGAVVVATIGRPDQ